VADETPDKTPDKTPDYVARKQQIRDELVRNPITEPLYSNILDDPDAIYNIMIDVNLQFHQGREQAFDHVAKLADEALTNQKTADPEVQRPESIGSSMNPYMSARLPGKVIQEMVRLDAWYGAAEADDVLIPAREAGQEPDRTPDAAAPVPAAAPAKPAQYAAIYRIWENFQVHPLIDHSIITVKADAARRAFLAEGRGICWAVIDSGVDGRHDHFAGMGTLDLKAPLKHFDFTMGKAGEGAPSALTDKFGHGSHVAGIIAGGVLTPRGTDQPKLQAMRTRLDPLDNIVNEVEPMEIISGMAPYCKIVSLKVLDDRGGGDVARVIAALDYVQRINDYGRQLLIHGVNLSLGYEFDPRWFACGQSPICTEVNRLVRSGVVVVVAAGNTGYGTLASKARNTGAGFMLTINDPGNAEYPITVGSTHRDMPHVYGVSYFSSKGPTGDGRPKPDLLAPGERILSCQSSGKNPQGATNMYVEDTGTSMAAPHVSGVIASFLSIRREFIGRPDEIKQLFLSSATDLKRERAFQGSGLIDLMRAIQSV